MPAVQKRSAAKRTAAADDYIEPGDEKDTGDGEEAPARPRARAAAKKSTPVAAKKTTAARRRSEPEEQPDDDGTVPEDENERPVRSSHVPKGWKAAKEAAENASSGYTNEFKFTDEAQLVKFLDSEPFAVYDQHWIERTGKKSFICPVSVGEDDCPLCDKGDTPRSKVAFSVLNLSADETVVEMLITSPTMTRQLADLDEDAKTGPLDRLYWALSKSGSKKQTSYSIIPVKPRDLDEDWGADPAEIEALVDDYEPLTADALGFTPYSELKEIAREMNR